MKKKFLYLFTILLMTRIIFVVSFPDTFPFFIYIQELGIYDCTNDFCLEITESGEICFQIFETGEWLFGDRQIKAGKIYEVFKIKQGLKLVDWSYDLREIRD